LVGGVDVFDDGGLRGLRDAANVAGFAQVYYGQLQHCGWFGREMRRIACEDAEARFVLVGYGVGAGNVASLAADARRRGLHVDGLVLLDPIGVPADVCTEIETTVHVVGSDRWAQRSEMPGCDVVRLPDVCHFAIATDPYTVDRTVGLLREAAHRVPDDAIPTPVMPLIDDPAPLPAVIPAAPPAGATARARRAGP
jgi:pimeloyl-ACP methyl ester carboxylesterase